jgi:hypothetical protein
MVFSHKAVNARGIWEVLSEFKIGQNLWENFGLDEPISDIQVLPN